MVLDNKVKEKVVFYLENLKSAIKLSDEEFERIYGVSKEQGMTNVLNAILEQLK